LGGKIEKKNVLPVKKQTGHKDFNILK
jgi:hypothetical protein